LLDASDSHNQIEAKGEAPFNTSLVEKSFGDAKLVYQTNAMSTQISARSLPKISQENYRAATEAPSV